MADIVINNDCVTSDTLENETKDDYGSLDFIGAAAHHGNNAEMTAKVMVKHGRDAVLISIMEEAAVTAWLAQAGWTFPYIVSLHIFESRYMANIFPVNARRLVESHWLSMACNSAQVVTFPSEGCVEDLRSKFSVEGKNVCKLWNPIDCAAVRRLSFAQVAEVSSWQNQTGGFRLIHVGRLDPQKNHDLLLDVCVELKRRDLLISLVIVGEGNDRQRIEKRIVELGISEEVKLVGEQKNPFPWIKAADALILTSHFEAFALVLVEALACGTPVVSVDCPAGPAEVLAYGKYGLLTPNYNTVALADAVEMLMSDPELCRKLVASGYKRLELFDIKQIVKKWQALIDSIPTSI